VVTTEDGELAYPPKLQPALQSPIARMRREASWLLVRGWRLATSDGAAGVARGTWRWTSRMGLRTYGMRRLAWWIWWSRRSGQHFLVAFVDVDGLSRVDQALGRRAAKRVVRAVGHAVRAELGARTLIFRYGGDEYVCALRTYSIAELENKLASARGNLIRKMGRGFTAGIAQLRSEDTPYTLVKRAELHMFGAKTTPGIAATGSLLPARREAQDAPST